MLCTISGLCALVRATGVTVAEAEGFFRRTMLHGHPVLSDMVAIYVDVGVVPGHIYPHERRFPKERLATCDTRPMCEPHDSFIVLQTTAVMKVGEDGESDLWDKFVFLSARVVMCSGRTETHLLLIHFCLCHWRKELKECYDCQDGNAVRQCGNPTTVTALRGLPAQRTRHMVAQRPGKSHSGRAEAAGQLSH